MPIPFAEPVPTPEEWVEHQKAVEVCRGAACYGALSVHFGTESPKALAWRIDRRPDYVSEFGERSRSNKYHCWRRDGTLPKPGETPEHVRARSGDSVNLDFWCQLILWDLLRQETPSIEWLHSRLEAFPAQIRRILFSESEPNSAGRYIHSDIGRQATLALRNLGSLDAFLTLLCLAREGEVLSDDPRHSLPAACAFDVLARVLYKHGQLRYRWEKLYTCLERIYWRRSYGSGFQPHAYSVELIRSNLTSLESKPTIALVQVSGKRSAKARPDSDPFVIESQAIIDSLR